MAKQVLIKTYTWTFPFDLLNCLSISLWCLVASLTIMIIIQTLWKLLVIIKKKSSFVNVSTYWPWLYLRSKLHSFNLLNKSCHENYSNNRFNWFHALTKCNAKTSINSFNVFVLNTLEKVMAFREYSTVSYHATEDDAKESEQEILLHNARDRENSEGNDNFFWIGRIDMSYFILILQSWQIAYLNQYNHRW